MKSKKNIIIAVCAIAFAILAFVIIGAVMTDGFDSKMYVETVLKQTFYGEVKGAAEIIGDSTEEELFQHYEEGVAAFVKNNVISGVEVDEETEKKFVELGEKIFGAMKFQVESEEKISGEEYDVTVSCQPSDVFLKYIELIQQETERIEAKVQNGEYQGTVEEINQQMQTEFLTNAYSLLQEAYDTMEYGEKTNVVFKVSLGENDLFQMNDAEIADFIVKIMRLDEIQD